MFLHDLQKANSAFMASVSAEVGPSGNNLRATVTPREEGHKAVSHILAEEALKATVHNAQA